MDVVKDQEHKSDEEWLRELGVLSLQKRRFRRDPIIPYIFLKEGFRQVGFSLFSQVRHQDKMGPSSVASREDKTGY